MAESTISSKQIRDGAITNAKVASGAAIDSSKLADGANFTKKDGSVAFTGNQSMGNNKLTNLAAPTAGSSDAARISDVETAISNLASVYKYKSVRAASTANVTISNPGTSTFDGVSLTSGDRVLLKDQSTQSQNGIYVFNGSGSAMTRAADADAWTEFGGALVAVYEGSTQGDTRWFCPVNDGGTLGSTAITFTQDTSSGLTTSNFVDKETPSGTINGSNTSFTLANTPTSGSEHLFLNGILQKSGAGNDYTISTNTITFTTAPVSGDVLLCSYRK